MALQYDLCRSLDLAYEHIQLLFKYWIYNIYNKVRIYHLKFHN